MHLTYGTSGGTGDALARVESIKADSGGSPGTSLADYTYLGAGNYIRQLDMRADAWRVLIVDPGSLVEQWRDELLDKFGLEFHIDTAQLHHTSLSPQRAAFQPASAYCQQAGSPISWPDHLSVASSLSASGVKTSCSTASTPMKELHVGDKWAGID